MKEIDVIKKIRNWASDRRYFYRLLWSNEGEYELRLLSKLVDRKRVAVDVGANQGVYSFHLSRFATRVEAFEPNPIYRPRLVRLGSKVILHEMGLSNKDGVGILNIPAGENQPAAGWGTLENTKLPVAESLSVQIETLDHFNFDPGFIKIDVEGHELAVLQGAAETIQKSRPIVLVECEEQHRKGAIIAVFDFFAKHDYRGFFFVDGRALPIETFDQKVHQASHGLKPGQHAARQKMNYINNFIFLPARSALIGSL
jgi:FkbM family methyltransferase